jgi:hypothetical protein
MAERKLAATITIGGAVSPSLGKAFGDVTKGAKGIGAELKAIGLQTKELEKMIAALKKAGKSTADLEKQLGALGRRQAMLRGRQARLGAIGGMLSSGGGLQLGPMGSALARGLAGSERFGPATVSTLTAVGAAAPYVAATAAAVAAVAAAAVAAGYGVFKLGQATADFIDNTADVADGLGVTTSNLLGLQYAASQSGIDAEKLNEKLGKMTLALESAKEGTGPTADALKELGLTWQEMSVLNPDEQVVALAQAFKEYNGNIPKVSLANAFFGKNSARFVNLLNQGRDGVRGMMKDARSAGYAVSQGQEDTAAKFDSAMSKVGISFKAIWLEIGTAVLPTINSLLQQMGKWLNSPETRAGFKAFGDALVPVMKTLGDNLPMLLSVMEKWLWVMTKVLQAFEAIASLSRKVGEGIGSVFYGNGSSPAPLPVQPRLPDLPDRPPGTGPIKTMFPRGGAPATPEVLRKQAASGKGFGAPAAAPATPAPADSRVYNFNITGATGANAYDIMEEVRRHLRDTQPANVGAY